MIAIINYGIEEALDPSEGRILFIKKIGSSILWIFVPNVKV